VQEKSIEKDEEILNNIKAYMQENIDKGYHKFVYNDLGYDEKCIDVINAIEHILSDYKIVLKENEESHRKENGELRERVKELEEWNEYYRKEMLSKEYIKLNYIPKSKVEEKIVELNKQLEEDLQDEIKVNSNRFIIICQCKSCLQELLGSEE
jgi:hypothetical protein